MELPGNRVERMGNRFSLSLLSDATRGLDVTPISSTEGVIFSPPPATALPSITT